MVHILLSMNLHCVQKKNTHSGTSRGWGRGLATPGPATFGGPAVDQK